MYLLWLFEQEQPMRDAAIDLRMLPEQRDLIDHAASLLGKIVSVHEQRFGG